MKALSFLNSLLPSFGKQTVLEDIRQTRNVLMSVTIPSYENAMRLFGTRKLANATLQKDWESFRRQVKGAQGANTIAAIEKTFKSMLSTLELVEKLVEKDYADDIEGTGVTYYKAAVLQMLESIGFAADYSLKYLNYVIIVETSEIYPGDDDEDEAKEVADVAGALTPAELRFINERFNDFCTIMATLSKPTDKIKIDFEAIPDITITATGDSVITSTVGQAKTDPFAHGFIPIAMNPIYHIRMRVADWQHNRYEMAKAEKQILELRKLKMEKALAGKKDAALEQQIEYTQKRIDNLNIQIRKVEEEYA